MVATIIFKNVYIQR